MPPRARAARLEEPDQQQDDHDHEQRACADVHLPLLPPRLSAEPPDEERRRDDEAHDEPDHGRDAPEQHEGRLACRPRATASSVESVAGTRSSRTSEAASPVAPAVEASRCVLSVIARRLPGGRAAKRNGAAGRPAPPDGFRRACALASDGTRLVELDGTTPGRRPGSRRRGGGRVTVVVVTNDDGVESPGIHALAEMMRRLGHSRSSSRRRAT